MSKPYSIKPIKERLERHYKIDQRTGCWNWTGCINENGYNIFLYKGAMRGAHRASYLIYKGVIEENTEIKQTCGNKNCINPDHLVKVPSNRAIKAAS